ncbi:uncharacterized protein N7482_004756 [Penicillium canariense]|uniref:Peptidyl-tRNA hydrolase n=1 Tax=Penicillium canariense TaxID=189055 RepID=A0A9W9IAX3_9EURO|nr:uncharacterized protein N7482_004756 [Penicillium canariense]KAJ5169162.1 hypothetical protein N7482_004756 [Penicillium canariense]
MALARPPRRLLFIASIGNPKPYRTTRHSAGHLLLDAITPSLRARLGPTTAPLYTTFYSPSLMNISGPKLVKHMQKWLSKCDSAALDLGAGPLPPGAAVGYPATLVILHDELEAPLGKVRVKRGGPESASLRGHRGLISVFETLIGKRLFPATQKRLNLGPGQKRAARGRDEGLPRELDILRVGVGIGRPAGREKNAVADYVLTEMEAHELNAVSRAAGPVVDVLEEEMSRESGSDGASSPSR